MVLGETRRDPAGAAKGGLSARPPDAASVPVTGPLQPRRLTAASQIGQALRDEIVAMRLLPGAPLQEKELTARFEVSRTPVREALIRLAEEGLVEIRPQAGTSVAKIPLAAIPEAVIVRQALEGSVVEIVTARGVAETEALDTVVRRMEAMATLDDRAGFHEADEAFHETLATLAGHPGIWRIVRQTKVQIDRCRRLTLPVLGRMAHVIDEHRVIVAAIAGADPAAARDAMRHHLQAVIPDARLLSEMYPGYFA